MKKDKKKFSLPKKEHENVLEEERKVEQTEQEEKVEDINVESTEEKLQKEIEALKLENDKLKNDYARAYADTENIRKRLQNEADQTRKYRIQSFGTEIVPVIDNLERALKTEVKEEDKGFYDGVQMIYNQLMSALTKEGIEVVDCLNKPFDANTMQALMQEKKEGVESGIVIEVLQKGYMLKDRILRPAMVKVSE